MDPFKTKLRGVDEYNWNIPKYEKAAYPERQKHSIETFDMRTFVKDRKSTRLNSSHVAISYAVFCLKKKNKKKKKNTDD